MVINCYVNWTNAVLLLKTFFFFAPGPPWVSRKVEDRQTAKLGHTVRLPCPVEGDPPPLVLWVKDGRNVNTGWSRYKVLRKSLKIKEVELEDAGEYICRVTNGFGSLALNFTLIVIGKDCLPRHTPQPFISQFFILLHTQSICRPHQSSRLNQNLHRCTHTSVWGSLLRG